MQIPRSTEQVIVLTKAAVEAAGAIGVAVGVKQNTADVIIPELETAAGRPAQAGPPPVPAIRGKLNEHATATAVAAPARDAYRTAQVDGRTFIGAAIDSLIGELGRRWNTQWAAAGFTHRSLAVPARNPQPLLLGLAAYLRLNPGHENADENVTAARAQELVDAIDLTRGNMLGRKVQQITARRERDASIQALRTRLSGLQQELRRLLPKDDPRWYQFGFTRPVDGHLPAPVRAVRLSANGPGSIIVEWDPAAVALNYRVYWRPNGTDTTPVVVGLFADTSAILRELPTGQTVIVGVMARNNSGFAAATEASILVP